MKFKFIISFSIIFTALATILSCSKVFYKKITIIGKALDDKDGAIVETETKDYLLDKLEDWDEKFYGKKVKVTGYLQVKAYKKRSTPEDRFKKELEKCIS